MPRYYFDINDGEVATGDEDGHCFEDAEAARRVAITTLTEIVSEALPDGANRDFTVKVRDGRGLPVFEAAMSFKSNWIGGQAKAGPGRRHDGRVSGGGRGIDAAPPDTA